MSTVVSTHVTTPQTLTLDESFLVTATGSITVASSNGIQSLGTDHAADITLLGDVTARNHALALAGTSAGAYMTDGIGDYRIFVGAGVTVANLNDFQSAMRIFGTGNLVENLGTIRSGGDSGIEMRGADAEIINHGDILGRSEGIELYGDNGNTIYRLVNTGTISGAEGIRESGSGSGLHLTNTGTITGTKFDGIDMDGAASYEQGIIINNSGTISAQGLVDGYALRIRADHLELDNSGALFGGILSDDLDDIVTNSGRIVGVVDLGSGADTFDGRAGTHAGTLDLGAGDDVAFLADGNATVDGGSGNDTVTTYDDLLNVTGVEQIRVRGQGDFAVTDDDTATLIDGNTGANEIDGAGGNDTLRGRLGDDLMLGGDDDDLLIGNAGNDELYGDNGLDTLFGGQGDDEIFGGFGNDELFGGAGDDTINPGGAQDTMSGGAGADVFLFESAADAGSGSSADRIDGFVRGVDVIDLVALGTTPASFIGTSGFSGGGNMEVRYTVNGFGNALVRIDENGDGTEDARVVVSQIAMLDAGDFLL